MQKVVNVLAIISFVGVAGIIGSGVYVYSQRDSIKTQIEVEVTAAVTEALTDFINESLPSMVDSAIPVPAELPTETGNIVPGSMQPVTGI
jgi:hypothetical protein